jgi:hypothetical protein
MKYKSTCYFYQESKCILSKKNCFLCTTNIKQIDSKLSIKYHLDYVLNRNRFRITFLVSLTSLLITLLLLVTKMECKILTNNVNKSNTEIVIKE